MSCELRVPAWGCAVWLQMLDACSQSTFRLYLVATKKLKVRKTSLRLPKNNNQLITVNQQKSLIWVHHDIYAWYYETSPWPCGLTGDDMMTAGSWVAWSLLPIPWLLLLSCPHPRTTRNWRCNCSIDLYRINVGPRHHLNTRPMAPMILPPVDQAHFPTLQHRKLLLVWISTHQKTLRA